VPYSYVYILENIKAPFPSCYVGKANNPAVRLRQHRKAVTSEKISNKRSYLYTAMRKYGEENFKLYIVEVCSNAEEAFNGEKTWIQYLREMGVHLYNISSGGYGGQIKVDDSITRNRKSKSQKARFAIPGVREYYSKVFKGRIKTPSTCQKIRESKRKAVLQYTKTGVLISKYNSGMAAEFSTNVSRSKICMCCQGKRKTAGGFVWKYDK